jgi:hypothetical protein
MKINFIATLLLATSSCVTWAADINHGYRISGDPYAAPLQAFDDGSNLYLQLRDTSRPPVPFTPDNKPVVYEVRAPYLVMPILDRVKLRYGTQQAVVEAAGKLPHGSAATTPVGDNLWYGGAKTAQMTGDARAPRSAAALAAKPVPVAAQGDVSKVDKVVLPNENELKPAREVKGDFIISGDDDRVEFVVSDALTVDNRVAVRKLAEKGSVRVQGDGTVKGWKRVKELASYLDMSGLRYEMKMEGASKGKVFVSN